jgi:hypothetical protein
MTHCSDCITELLEGELIICDPCRMNRVFNKMFTEIVDNA